MDAVVYIRNRNKMHEYHMCHDSNCGKCPTYMVEGCFDSDTKEPEKLVEAVKQWMQTHPDEAEMHAKPPKDYAKDYDTRVCTAVRNTPWEFVDILNEVAHDLLSDEAEDEDVGLLIAEAACVIANLLMQTGGVIGD